mmetsp:Transcript_686/g.1174  ORF Transcript_686/g.1174 Transcript_686/m.1174 type:complete len:211 (+) Transcript_686:1708-2340(+)
MVGDGGWVLKPGRVSGVARGGQRKRRKKKPERTFTIPRAKTCITALFKYTHTWRMGGGILSTLSNTDLSNKSAHFNKLGKFVSSVSPSFIFLGSNSKPLSNGSEASISARKGCKMDIKYSCPIWKVKRERVLMRRFCPRNNKSMDCVANTSFRSCRRKKGNIFPFHVRIERRGEVSHAASSTLTELHKQSKIINLSFINSCSRGRYCAKV